MSSSKDRSPRKHDSDSVRLLVPLIVLVLAFTAVPVELRRFDLTTLSVNFIASDLVANVMLYVPIGIVAASLGFWRTVMIAGILSSFAETCQFFMMHRYPSLSDLALNVTGAMTGVLINRRWGIDVPTITLNARIAWPSVLLVLGILGLRAWSDWEELSVNCRGATLPGSLEGRWTFDESVGGAISDSSGNGLGGRLGGGARLEEGIRGKAVRLDGKNDYVDFGQPVELRLMGSMTLSAWIKPTSFPADDAAIISTHRPGYQLDTTVDRGPRTVGFKLVAPCGELMARYGATELLRDTWYHVAGVYDADARTLHVYLNGRLDDGFLLAPIAPAQLASNQTVFVGRRGDSTGFEFAGLIDDARIHSRALTQEEIEQAMNGDGGSSHTAGKRARALASEILEQRLTGREYRCHQPTRDEDAIVPGIMVAVGILSALACAGFWPGHRLAILGVSLAIGLLVIPAATFTLPPYVLWMLPLLSLTGGASVMVSLQDA